MSTIVNASIVETFLYFIRAQFNYRSFLRRAWNAIHISLLGRTTRLAQSPTRPRRSPARTSGSTLGLCDASPPRRWPPSAHRRGRRFGARLLRQICVAAGPIGRTSPPPAAGAPLRWRSAGGGASRSACGGGGRCSSGRIEAQRIFAIRLVALDEAVRVAGAQESLHLGAHAVRGQLGRAGRHMLDQLVHGGRFAQLLHGGQQQHAVAAAHVANG